MKAPIDGVIPAVVTPFADNGKVDVEAIGRLVDFLVSKGVDGLFVCGTTGEGVLLSPEERKLVAEVVLQHCDGRVPVVAHVGDIRTSTAIDLAAHARSTGVDAVACITPFYYSVEESDLAVHFAEVGRAAGELPFFLYNIPGNTHHVIATSLIDRLFEMVPNLMGIKDSMGDIEQLRAYLQISSQHPDFKVFVGSDALDCTGLELGAAGVVSSMAGVVPEVYVNLYRSIRRGDVAAARQWQARIDDLRRILLDGRSLAMFKMALASRGVAAGSPRRPLPPFNHDYDGNLTEFRTFVAAVTNGISE